MAPAPPNLPVYIHPDVWLDNDHIVAFTPHGGILWHRSTKYQDGWCCGGFFFTQPPDRPKVAIWQVVQRDPLHITPSFLCHCGHHGYIHHGGWVAA